MDHGEGKEYASFESLDKNTLNDLNELEKRLQYKPFIKGNVISIDDVEAYENFMLLNVELPANGYSKMKKWKAEIERMKLNWKISKKKDKGRTFGEYIQNMSVKLKEQDQIFDDKMRAFAKIHTNIMKHPPPEKEVATIHFFKKIDEVTENKK
jgi:hypothetical protein